MLNIRDLRIDPASLGEKIPKDKAGRFILHDGTVFQGFWVDDTKF